MQAIIFIGIQASGKSSFYKEHFFNSHVRISMDLLNTRNKENLFLDTCFTTHTQFVVDNTNPTGQERNRYITRAKTKGYEVVGYYFSSKVEDAIRRNDLRMGKEKISAVGIRSCARKLEMPTYNEGFDKLYFVELCDQKWNIQDWNDEI